MDLKARAKQLSKDIPALFLAMRKAETPWYAKAIALLCVAYALSPIDLIPDFIPVLGYIDDLLLLPSLVWVAVNSIPSEVLEECRKEAEGMWQNGKPKKWIYALPIGLIYALIVWLVLRRLIWRNVC